MNDNTNKEVEKLAENGGDGKKRVREGGAKKKKGLSKQTASAIYMGVALCMILALTFSMVSTTDKVNKTVEQIGDISISFPDVSISLPQINESYGGFPDNDEVAGNVSGVTGDITEPESESEGSAPNKPAAVYVRPVDGAVIKGYFADALVFSETMQDFRTHSGVDIAAPVGAPVLAYTDGTVAKVYDDPFMGTTVEINHEAGVVSVYKNLSADRAEGIKAGAAVKTGDVIGTVGSSAIIEIADASHLHFELWMNGDCIDAEREIASLN